jgi:hypothetical protein
MNNPDANSSMQHYNLPERYPYQIVVPRSSEDVAATVKKAISLDKRLTVRSGGHLFPCQNLQDDEFLVDMKQVNPRSNMTSPRELSILVPGKPSKMRTNFLPHEIASSSRLDTRQQSDSAGSSWLEDKAIVCRVGASLRKGGSRNSRWSPLTAKSGYVMEMRMQTFSGQREAQEWAFLGSKFWARTIPAKKVYHLDWVFSIDNYQSTGHSTPQPSRNRISPNRLLAPHFRTSITQARWILNLQI